MLQDGFRDDGIEGVVFERQKMSVTDKINCQGRLDVEVDDIWCAASSARTEVQDVRFRAELPEEAFNASVPAGGGTRTSNKEGQQPVSPEGAFQA